MEQFQNLPTPVKSALGLVGITAVSAGGFVFLGKGFLVFLGILSVLLILFLLGYFAWKSWARKKQSAKLGGQLEQHSSAAPRDISDPGKRARLDDLRRKFEDGVREYKARGKDLYKLPWYVIVGPPASGKTEAIRNSNLGFPSAMLKDPLQGVGGTINMNWWFTNQAVILDTAGRLMFEEVKPGETSEWREFLNLLKKNRPNCPINGLLLAISVDSLIKDSAEQIQARAGKIAQQLDLIQRVLDVRFPVYVIVTKADLLTGFREFFNGITDPHLQHQMMGWSNPDPLDAQFRPDQVDQHLETVLKRLRRRRLGLLRDPVSDGGGRRTDEVDSLFALPGSFSLIAPRLRRYLETIFVAGEWSAKPLFLRGIYFTSSMREGSALDQELAQAIGISVEQLPEGAKWDKERAFFLRDLFLEKVFKERGLVTRATNTIKLLRGRQTALYGTGFAALIIFICLFVFGTRSFRNSIGDQTAYWQTAADNWQPDRTWFPIGSITGDKFEFKTNEQQRIPLSKLNRKVPRTKFHADLKEFAHQPLRVGVFAPIASVSDLDERKRKAQRIVFEGSVLRPIVQAARHKVQEETKADNEAVKRHSRALAALVKLEKDIAEKDKRALNEPQATSFLGSFLAFLNDEELPAPIDPNITQTMSWIYTEGDGRDTWPPLWLSGGQNLKANQPLAAGLERFLTNILQTMQGNKSKADLFNQLSADVQAFRAAEAPFINAGTELPAAALFTTLSGKAAALSNSLHKAQQAGLFTKAPSLGESLQKVNAGTRTVVEESLAPVTASLKGAQNLPLFDEIRRAIDSVKATAEEQASKLITGSTNDLPMLDQEYLEDSGGMPLYAVRIDIYRLAYDRGFVNSNLVGENWKALATWQANAAQVRTRALNYQGKYANHTNVALRWFKAAEVAACDGVRAQYVEQVKNRLLQGIGFPLVQERTPSSTLADLNTAKITLSQVQNDLASPLCKQVENGAGPGWTNFTSRVTTLAQIATAVLGSNQVPGECKMILSKPTLAAGDFREIFEDIGINAGTPMRARENADVLLTALRLDQPVTINVYSSSLNGSKPALQASFAEWALLKLMHDYIDPAAPRNGATTRSLKMPLKAFQPAKAEVPTEGHISFALEFNYPLPEVTQWPTREQLRKLSAH